METDYDPAKVAEITWGYIQPATRRFMDNYCDECYVVVPNYSIPGFDSAKFVAALKEIDPNADFDPPEPSPVPPPPPPPTPGDVTLVGATREQFNAEFNRRFGYFKDMSIGFTGTDERWAGKFIP